MFYLFFSISYAFFCCCRLSYFSVIIVRELLDKEYVREIFWDLCIWKGILFYPHAQLMVCVGIEFMLEIIFLQNFWCGCLEVQRLSDYHPLFLYDFFFLLLPLSLEACRIFPLPSLFKIYNDKPCCSLFSSLVLSTQWKFMSFLIWKFMCFNSEHFSWIIPLMISFSLFLSFCLSL